MGIKWLKYKNDMKITTKELKEIFNQCINLTNMSQDCQVVTLDRNIYETNRLISYLQAIRHRLFTTFTETHRNTSECFD